MSATYEDELLDSGFRRISLTGRLDAPGTREIQEQVGAIIRAETKDVVVDLAGVDYISSFGMRMLLVEARNLRDGGATLRVAAPNKHVREIIKLVGYDLAFPVYDTIEDALAALGE